MNNLNNSKPTRLSKVYFTWVIRDYGTAEWFHSLLHAIEEQDTMGRIEINIYLTAKIKEDEMNNIIVRFPFTAHNILYPTPVFRFKMSALKRMLSPPFVRLLTLVDPTGIASSHPS
jgi:hypothetical protein